LIKARFFASCLHILELLSVSRGSRRKLVVPGWCRQILLRLVMREHVCREAGSLY